MIGSLDRGVWGPRLLAGLFLLACAHHPLPPSRPTVAGGLTVVVVSAIGDHPAGGLALSVRVTAPAQARLEEARLTDAPALPCQAGRRVAGISVDHRIWQAGPADLGGVHELELRYPSPRDAQQPGRSVLDLLVSLPALEGTRAECIRVLLTAPLDEVVIP